MVLLDQGCGVQVKEWIVDEKIAPSFSRVYYILSGEVHYFDDEVTKKLDIGKLYIFPSSKKYKLTHNPNAPINCFWLHLDLLPSLVNQLIEIDLQSNYSLYYLIQAMRHEFDYKKSMNPYRFSLINSFVKYCYENNYLSIKNEEFSNILSFIHENYTRQLTVDEISDHFNYTPEHFIRMFQKKINTTPYQYITNCRMSEAIRLLVQDTPVIQVAQHLGYSDSKTFSHAFRLRFGIPPSKYKLYYKPMA